MGNTPSIDESNAKAQRDLDPNQNGFTKAFDPNQNGVALAFDPNANGVNREFDPANSNGMMGKIKDAGTDAFGKNGVGNFILRKGGEIGNKIGDVYNTVGTAGLIGGTALDAVGLPEFGVPIQAVSGALMGAGAITKKGSQLLNNTADLIEKPKKDRGDDGKEATKLLFF